MDCQDYIIVCAERKKGQHLGIAERGAIKALKQQGLGTRAIAREIGCVPSTITNELRRGTPARKSSKGKAPGYSPKLGQAVYEANRVACHLEEGHWEGDTVVGKRAGKESVVFSLLEKKTETYLAFRIPEKTSEAVMNLMNELHDEYGEHFSQIFKTITVDNGSEFADFAKVEKWGAKAFFAHPYTAWERPQNERHNGLFRAFVPKGASLEQYTDEDILAAADELNGRPRRKLGYRTPEELFEAFLDAVYAA